MTTLDLDALERAARAAAQAHAPFEIKEGPDYAEVIDRNGEKVALTVRPELFRLIEQFPALTSDYRALQERVEGAEKALRPFAGAQNPQPLPKHFEAARAYFAARTKAGEPHEQE